MGVLSISMPRGDLRKVKFSVKEGDIDRSDLITEIYMTVKRSPRSENYIFQKRMSITTGGVVSAMTMVGTASLYGFQISFLLG